MSLYHETADILSIPASTGGGLKSRIFGKKDHKTVPQQIYALAVETCKWSLVLAEVIEKADFLHLERKLTPLLSLLLVHDLLLSKKGIALPASHGLRIAIERHKARLTAEFTRARLRRKASSVEVLRQQVESAFAESTYKYPRWVRVNALLSSLEDQLNDTFKGFEKVQDIGSIISGREKLIYVDEHIPDLVAISPSFEIVKTDAYKAGYIILQDKASCFPAYLLDPAVENGDVIDSCAAPGNKTTHLASIIHSQWPSAVDGRPKIFAFERNAYRAKTLENMVRLAGGDDIISISPKQDFLKVDPEASRYAGVSSLLLDPSCSGSGIVGRDGLPTIHIPEARGLHKQNAPKDQGRKRKRTKDEPAEPEKQVFLDDDGHETIMTSENELRARLETLSSFQLILLLHAFKFPAARRITYSTCSIHAQENEKVVIEALKSDIARARGWRILTRDRQVEGMRKWPVRGEIDAAEGDESIADACIRSYKDDGRGTMGFFVAAFIRDGETPAYTSTNSGSLSRKGNEVVGDGSMPQGGRADAAIPSKANKSSKQKAGKNPSSRLGSSKASSEDEEEWGGFDD
ncbi:NOL1/NOP2/sun family protein [Xylariales sp. PMI_506]|nr:NOL1/NOP2/sun family protein [Xylariales sp. PMI_506]